MNTIARLLLVLLLSAARPARADQYHGNGNTGFSGAIGNGTLTLADDGTNISGTLNVGGSMDDVLVLYLQTDSGGFASTSGFNDQGDACRQAISGASASGRSLLTFASGFQPNYAIALAPAAAGAGALYQLANGGNNSLVYLTNLNLAPLHNSGPYTFNFPAGLIGMVPGIRSTIQVFGTYVSTNGYRSAEAVAGDLTGSQGWNPFTQAAFASYTFDASAVLVKLPVGLWAPRAIGPPSGRCAHTAVWTGSEMIVWGGTGTGFGVFNDGGRYSPAANVWAHLPSAAGLAGRYVHTVVWSGNEMIVWGGYNDGLSRCFNDGGRYNPTANSWTAVPTNGAPARRYSHTAVWTGNEMIVWGGYNGSSYLNDGGRYDPLANSWTALPATSAPAARENHTAVWTGSEMIVWGGDTNQWYPRVVNHYYADGARYDPTANSWTALPTTGAPAARCGHTGVWTGSEMVLWGGGYNDGARYNPAANNWTAVTTNGAPAARVYNTGVWTGSELIVWGGQSGSSNVNDGGRYNPVTDSWAPLPTSGAPAARYFHTALWAANEMLVWGGRTGSSYLSDGGRYNPVADSWTALPISAAPAGRQDHTALWTGSEMIVWGGHNWSSSALNDGARYDPTANSWTAVPTNGAPPGRYGHTAVWTGSEMMVWGGYNNVLTYPSDGGRYNPAANSWTYIPKTLPNTPGGRIHHTAVWTDSEMIVWGGGTYVSGTYSYYKNGGRYNPAANTWTALPTSGAPAARWSHTAVWTGSQMIIWGGWNGAALNDGGLYSPSANGWTPVTTIGAPAPRACHAAVWTGHEMILWGGSGSSYFNDGGRYTPGMNSWAALATAGAPAPREYHTAVWTGSEMIVWGGYDGSSYFKDGGRYNPAGNNWIAVPNSSEPEARYAYTAVWTGSEMVVFGGQGNGSTDLADTWSYYPYAPAVRVSRSGPSSAEVAWPVWYPSLRLCQTTNLSAGPWTPLTNDVTQVGAENHVTVSPLSVGQFFRAQYP